MSKDKSTAPKAAKFATQDEAKEALAKAKEAVQVANDAMEAFLEENKLKRKVDLSEDPKHGKAWKKLKAAITAARETRDGLKEAVKELKPKSERGYQYEYPDDVKGDAVKMKKFRTQQRAAKRKAEKEVTTDEAAPKKKKAEAAPDESAPKAKKKKAVAED